jgi:ribose-phosphate pyrophosphokinase
VVRARAALVDDGQIAVQPSRDRPRAGVSEVMNVIGDVAGRDCILIDDLVDSGGTHCNAAEALIKRGARSASAYVTHGVLSGAAVARIADSPIRTMTITDSIQATEAVARSPKIVQVTIAPLLAEAIKRTSEETSVSSLFD